MASLVTQPKFAPQLTNFPTAVGYSASSGGIQRGYMIWDQPMTSLYDGGGPLGDGRDVINFLFNPSTVTSDYTIANTSLQAAMLYQVPGDNGNLTAPLSQTVSWQLYFDRMYELAYGTPDGSTNDPTVIGCQADVLQFMQFTGLLASLSESDQASILGGAATSSGVSAGGIMMMVPCWAFFSNSFNQATVKLVADGSTSYAAVNAEMSYYGFINEWSVNYTHWTTSMVPIRCTIDVSFTMLPQPGTGGGQAAWQDAATLQGNYVSQPSGVTPVGSVALARVPGRG